MPPEHNNLPMKAKLTIYRSDFVRVAWVASNAGLRSRAPRTTAPRTRLLRIDTGVHRYAFPGDWTFELDQ